MFVIGQRNPVFDTVNEGGSGGTGEVAHPVTAPWSGAEGVWQIGEGDTAAPWFSTIPEEDARQHVEAKGYKNPAELALANLNLTRLQRGDPSVVVLPGSDATPEQMSEFYGRLGRPQEASGYEFTFAEGVNPDDGMMEFARTTFHEAGLTPAQAQIVADKWNAFVADQATNTDEAWTQQNDADLAALQTRWGADFEKNRAAGERAMRSLGIEEGLMQRIESGIGSAAVVELLAMIGRKSDEGGFTSGGTSDPNDPATMNAQQAQARLTTLQSDPAFVAKYTNKNDPGHMDALRTMEQLYARI